MAKYSLDFKQKVVHYYLNKGLGYRLCGKYFNISAGLVERWVKAYLLRGKSALNRQSKKLNAVEKFEIIHLIQLRKYSLTQASYLFNINIQTLNKWLLGCQEQGVLYFMNKTVKQNKDETELEKLRRENQYLKAENAYLKKLRELLNDMEKFQPKRKQKP